MFNNTHLPEEEEKYTPDPLFTLGVVLFTVAIVLTSWMLLQTL